MSIPTIEELIQKGWGRSVTVGALSTGIVGGGDGTVFDQDQPEFAIGVPAGVCIRPFYAEVVVQGGVATTDSDETEALIAVDSLGLWTGDGTLTNENPSNLRTDLDKGSMCRVGSAFTGNMTTTPGNGGTAAAPVLDMELARVVEINDQAGTVASATYRIIRLEYQPNYPPFLVGPCTLLGYWGGTRATVGGFAVIQWVEGPVSEMLPALAGL